MTSVNTLLNTHLDIVREVETLSEKVDKLEQDAENLCQTHPERSEEVSCAGGIGSSSGVWLCGFFFTLMNGSKNSANVHASLHHVAEYNVNCVQHKQCAMLWTFLNFN